ncbi:hypothetical protein GEV33_012717 [Tenebrio molitor]|uniref:Uncharacterized protein n=1 Tax=Tenebrio molitor TaxID=7067 RepID=A0A8J6H964_TENMO|nr:hypothetical protein GEV33_012717 [Tenebrio molitor]
MSVPQGILQEPILFTVDLYGRDAVGYLINDFQLFEVQPDNPDLTNLVPLSGHSFRMINPQFAHLAGIPASLPRHIQEVPRYTQEIDLAGTYWAGACRRVNQDGSSDSIEADLNEVWASSRRARPRDLTRSAPIKATNLPRKRLLEGHQSSIQTVLELNANPTCGFRNPEHLVRTVAFDCTWLYSIGGTNLLFHRPLDSAESNLVQIFGGSAEISILPCIQTRVFDYFSKQGVDPGDSFPPVVPDENSLSVSWRTRCVTRSSAPKLGSCQVSITHILSLVSKLETLPTRREEWPSRPRSNFRHNRRLNQRRFVISTKKTPPTSSFFVALLCMSATKSRRAMRVSPIHNHSQSNSRRYYRFHKEDILLLASFDTLPV